MRDIRNDLQERLAGVMARRESLQREVELLGHQVTSIQRLLDEENKYWDALTPRLFANPSANQNEELSLSDLIVEGLDSFGGAASLEELKGFAAERGYSFGEKHPGREIGRASCRERG